MRPKIGHFSWFSGENCSIFLRSRLRRSRTYLFLGREARSKVTHSWKRAFRMIWDNKIEKPGYPSAAVDVGEQLRTDFFSTISMQTAQVSSLAPAAIASTCLLFLSSFFVFFFLFYCPTQLLVFGISGWKIDFFVPDYERPGASPPFSFSQCLWAVRPRIQ